MDLMAWHFPAKVDSSVETRVSPRMISIFPLVSCEACWTSLSVRLSMVSEMESSLHKTPTTQTYHPTSHTFTVTTFSSLAFWYCMYYTTSIIAQLPHLPWWRVGLWFDHSQLPSLERRIPEELKLRSKSGSVEGPKIGLSWRANA